MSRWGKGDLDGGGPPSVVRSANTCLQREKVSSKDIGQRLCVSTRERGQRGIRHHPQRPVCPVWEVGPTPGSVTREGSQHCPLSHCSGGQGAFQICEDILDEDTQDPLFHQDYEVT